MRDTRHQPEPNPHRPWWCLIAGLLLALPAFAQAETYSYITTRDKTTHGFHADFLWRNFEPILPVSHLVGGGLTYQGYLNGAVSWEAGVNGGQVVYHVGEQEITEKANSTHYDDAERLGGAGSYHLGFGVPLRRRTGTVKSKVYDERSYGALFDTQTSFVAEVPTDLTWSVLVQHEGWLSFIWPKNDMVSLYDPSFTASFQARWGYNSRVRYHGAGSSGLGYRRKMSALSASYGARWYTTRPGVKGVLDIQARFHAQGNLWDTNIPGMHLGLKIEHGPLFPDDRLRSIIEPPSGHAYESEYAYRYPASFAAVSLELGVGLGTLPRVTRREGF
jgi:hypothetical protein